VSPVDTCCLLTVLKPPEDVIPSRRLGLLVGVHETCGFQMILVRLRPFWPSIVKQIVIRWKNRVAGDGHASGRGARLCGTDGRDVPARHRAEGELIPQDHDADRDVGELPRGITTTLPAIARSISELWMSKQTMSTQVTFGSGGAAAAGRGPPATRSYRYDSKSPGGRYFRRRAAERWPTPCSSGRLERSRESPSWAKRQPRMDWFLVSSVLIHRISAEPIRVGPQGDPEDRRSGGSVLRRRMPSR
jgi:hypothetical protein